MEIIEGIRYTLLTSHCGILKRPYKVEKEWTVAHFESVPVTYPDTAFKTDIRVPPSPDRDEFIKGLLEIDRTKRLGSSNHYHGFEQDIKAHPWLKSIDWKLIEQKKLQPNYRPNVCRCLFLQILPKTSFLLNDF